MGGIDADGLRAQEAVLREARAHHQQTLDEAIGLEHRAMRVEQQAHDEAAAALAVEKHAHDQVLRARVMQAEQRHAVRECSADIAEITEVLRSIPQQRQAPPTHQGVRQ